MAKKAGAVSGIGNATVFVDLNGNGILDSNEVSTTANADGTYQLVGKGKELKGTLVVQGGINLATQQANTEVFTAAPNAKVINSLTTLVQALAEEAGIKVGKAAKQLQESLGLKGVNILRTDPASVAENGKPGSAKVEKALKAMQVQEQLDAVLKLGTSVLAGAADAGAASLQSALLKALASELKSGTGLNLSNQTQLTSVLNSAAANAGLSSEQQAKVAAAASDTAKVISATTSKIASAVASVIEQGRGADKAAVNAALQTVTNVEKVTSVAASSLEQGVSSGNLTNVVNQFTGSGLDNAVNNPGQIPTPPVPEPNPNPAPDTTPTTPTTPGGVAVLPLR